MGFLKAGSMGRAQKGLLFMIGAVYIAFIALDLFYPALRRESDLVKLIGILLCFFLACAGYRRSGSKSDGALLCFSALLTAMVD